MADTETKSITTRKATSAIPHPKEKQDNTNCHCFVGFCVLALLASSITLLVYYVQCAHGVKLLNAKLKKLTAHRYVMNDTLVSMHLMQYLDADRIRDNLRNLSAHPHLAGTGANYKTAKFVQESFKGYGIETHMSSYNVLLSYPNASDPNKIYLLDNNGSVVLESPVMEKAFLSEENDTDVVQPFNGYSAPGVVTGDLVYVNYGRKEDFEWLVNVAQMNVKGKIVIARYGRIFRGNKAKFAEDHGAAGVILYSDPADYGPPGNEAAYPESIYLPDTGVQRGTVMLSNGDPQTIGFPSTKYAFRRDAKYAHLPTIPVQPIGYGFAEKLLARMTGNTAPQSWQGSLNITYRLGPGLTNGGWKVKMDIKTKNQMATIHNVFGVIQGSVEPDRYVLVGNHRDAWGFGSMDPSSGTAVMLEMARVMGGLLEEKWQPRRTIIFCSWDAEEYGLIGSREWVEQYIKNLHSRAVAYINVDVAIPGQYSFSVSAVPLLNQVVYQATQRVPNPNPEETKAGRKTVFDTWNYTDSLRHNRTYNATFGKPRISIPGSGSDHLTFLSAAGIPVTTFSYDPIKGFYPLYHSGYESFYLVNNLTDPGFKYSKAIGQVWNEVARNLADSVIIPFNVEDYACALSEYVQQFSRKFEVMLMTIETDMDVQTWLSEAIYNFTMDATKFMRRTLNVDMQNTLEVRKINDQLMQLERAFLSPMGSRGHVDRRHTIFSPSDSDSYSASQFPGLWNAAGELSRNTNEKNLDRFKQEYALLIFSIQSASSVLKPVVDFWL